MSGHPSSSKSGGGGGRHRPSGSSSGAVPPSGSGNNRRPAMTPFYPQAGRGQSAGGTQPPPTGGAVAGPPFLPQPPQGMTQNQLDQLYNRTAPGHPPAGMRPTGPRVPLTVALPPGAPMLPNRGILRPNQTNTNYALAIHDAPQTYAIPPLDFQISMIEICTIFPSWFQIPDVASRAYRNGWSRKDIAKAQLHARNRLNKANLTTAENRVQKQIGDGGRMYSNLDADERWNIETQRNREGTTDDLTANTWELRAVYQHDDASEWGHMLLADIASSVPGANWPTGQDAMLVTQCLRFALNNQNLRLDTSHWHVIFHRQNFARPPWANHTHDQQARDNFRNRVADPAN